MSAADLKDVEEEEEEMGTWKSWRREATIETEVDGNDIMKGVDKQKNKIGMQRKPKTRGGGEGREWRRGMGGTHNTLVRILVPFSSSSSSFDQTNATAPGRSSKGPTKSFISTDL